MPKISIILPVYNVEKYISQCIESILSQTLSDIEIICIDDCSTDNSSRIILDYADKDSRIKIFLQSKNKGQGVTRNIGLKLAQGEYTMFIDPDDWIEQDTCEIAYNQIKKNNNDFVIFNYNKVSETGTIIKTGDYRIRYFEDAINSSNIKLSLQNKPFMKNMLSCVQIYNTSFLKENNITFANLRLGEDVPFLVKAMTLADSISIIQKPLYNYRIYENSTSFKCDLFQNIIDARKLALDIILDRNSEIFTKSYVIYCIRTLLLWYKRFKHNKKIKSRFYKEIHKFFITLSQVYDIEKIRDEIDYRTFKDYLQYRNLIEYSIFREIKRVFYKLSRQR